MNLVEQLTAGLADNTKKTASSLLVNHLLPYVDHTPDVGRLIETWRASGLGPRTILKLISLYRSWHYLVHKEPVDTSRWVRIVSRTIVKDERIWTVDQCVQAITESYHINRPLHRMMVTTMHTGLRKAELFGLQGKDIDLPRRRFFVYKTMHGGMKTGKPRVVDFTDSVESIIREINPGPEDFLFTRCSATDMLQRFCRVTGLPKISWHTLRDIYATVLLDNGASLRQVADLLGHAKVSTTADKYWRNMNRPLDLEVLPCSNY